ncbi:hypothetical protein X753_30635 [Mesorhizobium sp. LNJC399B00]|uniref:type II toxin-antitoxin system RelE/ParE family toxin n=1 Tax=unclassified Mesorhizobium TaxID=325217 RepID=UPI0003CED47F|nr:MULTISPECIES: type II toxin-antitoxin system RelE/ParE family toxin [unclassified Mesorhizobium]ESX99150.1 hypothetical protein X753_30635 [Mesorhizobium sp. LNJC399B00]WJI67426.1 type II toxin-antitoxin system RelE/ParE family toxin [Mesorhizobium sp. C399B]
MTRQVLYIASSEKDLKQFPIEVKQEVVFALRVAQDGGKSRYAVPMVGFNGASVPEIILNHNGDAYRAVYTVRFKEAVYVLHAFMKKSKVGSVTPRADMNLIRRRLKEAEAHYQRYFVRKIERQQNGDT